MKASFYLNPKIMTLQEKAQIALTAASEKSMSGSIWTKDAVEVRVYLRRTNAARDEAGYIRIWIDDAQKSFSVYVPQSGGGKGSRTAAAEGEAVYGHYQMLRKAAVAAKKSA